MSWPLHWLTSSHELSGRCSRTVDAIKFQRPYRPDTSLDHVKIHKAPRCFSRAILLQRRLAFLDRVHPSSVPRRHQYYQGAKTSCAEYEVAYGFASSLQSLSPGSLPCGGDFRPGLARLSPVAFGVLNWSSQDLPGSWGIHPVPLPRSQIPAGPTDLTVTVSTVLPPL